MNAAMSLIETSCALAWSARAARPSAVSARVKRAAANAVAASLSSSGGPARDRGSGVHRRLRKALSRFEWAVRPSASGARWRPAQSNASRALSPRRSNLAGPVLKCSAELQVGSGASFARVAAVVALRHYPPRAGSSQLGRSSPRHGRLEQRRTIEHNASSKSVALVEAGLT